MVPKIIHLCWFSNDPYPIEIKICLDTWHRLLPDYKVKVWNYQMARSIGISFINEALEERRWAFASDVVRFYAVWKEGGVYMDSDILLLKRFDDFIPDEGFSTFIEDVREGGTARRLQAAFFSGSPGNTFCKDMLDYYRKRHYRNADGTQDNTISPMIMGDVAARYGFKAEDVEQTLDGGIHIYPTHFLAPKKNYPIDGDTIGQHRIYGSWRKRKLGRRIEIAVSRWWFVTKYRLRHRI